ncbi:MAG: hypothetical protein KIT48_19495 [Pseudolabrys sp.]|nr:hypothetical protein [Pseudolabrys sp.]
MSKPTTDQLSFARTMSRRQRLALWNLADHPAYMSVSEQIDAEFKALIKHGLAAGHSTTPDGSGPFMWAATDAGKAISKQVAAGEL